MQTLSPQQARAVVARVQSHLDAGALEEAVTLAEEQMTDAIGEARAILQHALALACNLVGRSVEAQRAAAAAREGFKAIDSREGELDALLAIGSVMRSAGDHASAMLAFEEAEPMARELRSDIRWAWCCDRSACAVRCWAAISRRCRACARRR
ncbi:MAG: hypothetical protein ACR2GP_12395 [Burkholderiaceae bacterium]